MVNLRGMVREGWYMVQESKLWYNYIIVVRSGNADFTFIIFNFCVFKIEESYSLKSSQFLKSVI